jgi:U8 snoRNA-decapping enzyme
MEVIDFNAVVEKKRRAAFVIFYALDGKPWENYSDKSEFRDLTIPTCLMINRSDGSIGFIGGKVEEGETLAEAAKREVEEEIGHKTNGSIEPLVAHDIGPITTHAFIAEVAYDKLRSLLKESVKGSHFGAELTGVFMPHLINYRGHGRGGGLANLLGSSMAPSVREELVHFLLKKNIFPKDELVELCRLSGYNLNNLLK